MNLGRHSLWYCGRHLLLSRILLYPIMLNFTITTMYMYSHNTNNDDRIKHYHNIFNILSINIGNKYQYYISLFNIMFLKLTALFVMPIRFDLKTTILSMYFGLLILCGVSTKLYFTESSQQLGQGLGRRRLLQDRTRHQRMWDRVLRFGHVARNRTECDWKRNTKGLPLSTDLLPSSHYLRWSVFRYVN